jgi:hypothetical protein
MVVLCLSLPYRKAGRLPHPLGHATLEFEVRVESMPIRDYCAALMAPRAATAASTCWAMLIMAILFQPELSYADDRPQAYWNDMRIMACIAAENAVRFRLKDQGQISFESCASDKFDIDLAANDRDYQVRGYGTLLPPNAGSVNKRFLVRMNHNPAAYGDWAFTVTKVEIDP